MNETANKLVRLSRIKGSLDKEKVRMIMECVATTAAMNGSEV